MSLTVTTDHTAIHAVVDRFVTADPVRGTLLGTIGASLEDSAWAAHEGPRLAVRSTDHYPVALAGEWDRTDLLELADLLAALPGLRGVSGLVAVVQTVLDALGRTGADRQMGQRLFRLETLTDPQGVDGVGVVATDGHRAFVRSSIAAFMVEADAFGHRDDSYADSLIAAGLGWLWLDPAGEPVSLAARRPAVGGSARVGPVYTPPAARGHGYGSAVTAAVTRSILAEHAIPVLFTDLANPTSNKIYQALGYEPVEDRLVVSFS
jgi:GNAT superfamily N-acetyltransferase